MTRWLLVSLGTLLQIPVLAENVHRELLIHFARDKYVLDDTARLQLLAFLDELDLSGDIAFHVQGHTDSDGTLSYNDTLARSRAVTIRAFLIGRGVPPAAISVTCSGERDPLVANTSPLGMAQNRRVRLSYARRAFADLSELQALLTEGSVQSFSMDPNRDLHWTGTDGTTLFIPAGMLVDATGQLVTGTVSMEVTEALDARSVIGHQLSTRSRERLLETGGMVRVRAWDNAGADLLVRPGGSIRMEVPAPMPANDMQLFTSLDGGTWEPTGQWLNVVGGAMAIDRSAPILPPSTNLGVRMPVYREDQKGRPVQPFPPFRPLEPTRPVPQALVPRTGSKRRKREALAQQDQEFAMAMERYERRHARYLENMRRYEADKIAYPEAVETYVRRKAEWDSLKLVELREWMTTRFLPYQRETGKVLTAAYARDLERYNAAPAAARTSTLAPTPLARDTVMGAEFRDRVITEEVTRFVVTANQLGWVNCDRFVSTPPAQMASVVVRAPEPGPMRVVLVSGTTRTIVAVPIGADGCASARFPMNADFTLIAFSVKEGRVQVFEQRLTTTAPVTIAFRESTFSELSGIFSSLNQWSEGDPRSIAYVPPGG